MAEVLNVKVRTEKGTSRMRRLRYSGFIPAELYGHGEANVSLVINPAEVWAAVKHGGKLVSLKGDINENALIRSVQWDTYGKELLHVDLIRVSESELVSTTVAIELKGTAVGTTEGGVIQFLTHEVEIECPAASIPEKIVVNITDLHLGKAIHAGELKLPAGAKLAAHPEDVIVSCVSPHKEAEAAVGAEGSAEPEVIGKKEKEAAEAAEKEGKK
ncbi:MAG: 50S ribosomal protein L25 [Planctomycetaceae bacterium]